MREDFQYYLHHICGCTQKQKYLLAVSGGIDSVVMAWLFKYSELQFSIAHCNFHLRNEESDGDQIFVEDLAQKLKVRCYITHFETLDFARSKGYSIQMAARELRYKWFEELRSSLGMDFIATAHNQDDMVETLLINLTRGTGIRGLTGIKPRYGKIIRPLLFAERDSIMAFAKEMGIRWRTDSSNLNNKYQRNVIRNSIIPEFIQRFPAFRHNVLNTIQNLEQTNELMNWTMDKIKNEIKIEDNTRSLIDIQKLKQLPAVETVLFELLREYGINASMAHSLNEMISGRPGKRIYTHTHTITRDRQYLIINKYKKNTTEVNEMLITSEMTEIMHPIKLHFSFLRGDLDGYPVFIWK